MLNQTSFKKGHVGYKSRLGKPWAEEIKKRISDKLKGRSVALKNGKFIRSKGETNSKWLGDKVGYWGIHSWLIKNFGSPNHCEFCFAFDSDKRYEWALLPTQKHERKRENYVRLCKKCHNCLDLSKNKNKPIHKFYGISKLLVK